MPKIDFQSLAHELLIRSWELLPMWLPGGRMVGREYTCANLKGGKGESCKVNIKTGEWADFASTEKGHDFISLYAAINGCKNGEAATVLQEQYSLVRPPPSEKTREIVLGAPEPGTMEPVFTHPKYGEPIATYCYKSWEGNPVFYVARYEPKDEKKQFVPYSWSPTLGKWCKKGFPEPRPLYGLEILAVRYGDPVLLVEGEKSAEAARTLLGDHYVVMTWSHGTNSYQKSDFSVLKDREILIWPDADEPGMEAALGIAKLTKENVTICKIIRPKDRNGGWDAADALNEGWDFNRVVEWAKANVEVYQEAIAEFLPPETPKPEASVVVNAESMDAVSMSVYSMWDNKLGLAKNTVGVPIVNADNIVRVIANWPDLTGKFWFDEFHHKIYSTWRGKAAEFGDVEELHLLKYLQREIGLSRFTPDIIRQGVTVYAHENPRNEPREWMDSLTWDGQSRIEQFFVLCLGAEYSEHNIAASKNWWLSMAARIYKPGIKVDNMIVLEGPQGNKKTTALMLIGGNWYAEINESVSSKDFSMLLQGKLIVEISEMDSFSRADSSTIKKVITCQVDRFRWSYGRNPADYPRQCVFVGTTNEDIYLKDHTGGRRFWPIKTGNINLDLIEEWREQLFAEASKRFKAGEVWWEMPEDTTKIQESRRQHDEWENLIGEYLNNNQGREDMTIHEIAAQALRVEPNRLDVQVQRRIGKIMRHFKWENRITSTNGISIKVWSLCKPTVSF